MASKRGIVEEKVFEAIEDIAEELQLSVPFYPEVHYIHRRVSFDDLWLPEREREQFEDYKGLRGSWYDNKLHMVFISHDAPEDISEEAAHFLHFTHSGIRYSNRSVRDAFALSVLVETIGFFCSKLIMPDRKNTYPDSPDLFFMSPEQRKEFLRKAATINGVYRMDLADDFYLYQQARGLGERMYYAFVTGDLSLPEFKRLFLSPFKVEASPSINLSHLKTRFWAPEDLRQRVLSAGKHQPKPLKPQKTPN